MERWGEIESLLKRIEIMDTPLSHVREMVRAKEAQVWCIGDPIECVWLTKVFHTLDHSYGLIWLGAGDQRLVGPHVASENWFREMGCQYVQIIGRRGWKKLLPDYEEQSVILVKEL